MIIQAQAMTRDPRFDLLSRPMRIGPVTAPNRFYQVPHCSGMGHERPHTLAAMRGMKAEGGWGVVYRNIARSIPRKMMRRFRFRHCGTMTTFASMR